MNAARHAKQVVHHLRISIVSLVAFTIVFALETLGEAAHPRLHELRIMLLVVSIVFGASFVYHTVVLALHKPKK